MLNFVFLRHEQIKAATAAAGRGLSDVGFVFYAGGFWWFLARTWRCVSWDCVFPASNTCRSPPLLWQLLSMWKLLAFVSLLSRQIEFNGMCACVCERVCESVWVCECVCKCSHFHFTVPWKFKFIGADANARRLQNYNKCPSLKCDATSWLNGIAEKLQQIPCTHSKESLEVGV